MNKNVLLKICGPIQNIVAIYPMDKTKAYSIKPQRTQFFTIINLDPYSANFAEPTKKDFD